MNLLNEVLQWAGIVLIAAYINGLRIIWRRILAERLGLTTEQGDESGE